MRTFLLTTSLLILSVSYLHSEQDFKITGNFQLRTELDGRDFSNKTYPLSFTSMRTMIGIEKNLTKNISAFFQIRDSRLWGEAKNTIYNLKNVDLHQGYVQFDNILDEPLSVKAGRFEMQFRNGRYFSTNNFHYIARSWDGVLFSYDTKPFGINIFALTHSRSVDAYIGRATPDTSQYPYPSKPEEGHNVYGFWSKFAFDKEHYLDLFSYYDFNRKRTTKGNYTSDRFMSGFYYKFSYNDFFTVLEGAYQGGEAGDQRYSKAPRIIQAFNVAGSLNYKIQDLTIGLNADILSGTSEKDMNEGKFYRTFDATYQGKHSFYSGMDYFSDIQKSTNNRGLNDLFIKITYNMNPWAFIFEGHNFTTNKVYKLQNNNESRDLGNELYLITRVNLLKNATLEWGNAVFIPGEVMKDVYDVNRNDGIGNYDRTDPAFWTYLMMRVSF
ncbi:MAG: alginate export family protein [Ignavibacteria bacterium]|nr:alginate export family protein [Ignavibacteria bacterium]